MSHLPQEMIVLLAPFAQLFSHRVWLHAQVLVVGAILSPDQRTVTAALRVMGLAGERRFTNYHRVLNRACWSSRQASKILLGLIVRVLVPPGAAIVLGADDTVERRSGRKIKAKGCYRDGVRSTKKHIVRCFGLKWVAMAVLVPVPWAERVWALPFLTVLCWPEAKSKKGRHKTSVDWVRQMTKQVRRWLPLRELVLVVDGGFAAVSLALACVSIEVVMVSRLRLDAALYHPPGPQPQGKRGPKPTKGKRQRSLKTWAACWDTPWQQLEMDWYGGQRKELWVFSRTALWYTPGWAPVEIRFVLVRDPEGELREEAFFCTNPKATPEQVLHWVIMRWSVEVTFEETRAHLGVETQRQWSDKAIERTTPVLLGLFSFLTLVAHQILQGNPLPTAQSVWYPKPQPTFSDVLAFVRRRLWQARYLVKSTKNPDLVLFPRQALELLVDQLCYAA